MRLIIFPVNCSIIVIKFAKQVMADKLKKTIMFKQICPLTVYTVTSLFVSYKISVLSDKWLLNILPTIKTHNV